LWVFKLDSYFFGCWEFCALPSLLYLSSIQNRWKLYKFGVGWGGVGGVQFKITLLYTTFAFTSSSVLWNFSKKSFGIICFLLLICELYGYQKDNVSNQREHVVHLLANEQSRLGIPDATEPVCLTCFCFIFGLISVLEF